MIRTIKNPHWTNNARTILSADFHYADGRILTAVINGKDTANPDWNEIARTFSEEQIESNTRAVMEKQKKDIEQKQAKEEAAAEKLRQEQLFGMKLRAFEVPVIKQTSFRSFKTAIRRAQTEFEVIAYAAAIILAENTANTPTEE